MELTCMFFLFDLFLHISNLFLHVYGSEEYLHLYTLFMKSNPVDKFNFTNLSNI
jgi:hypothetical protein